MVLCDIFFNDTSFFRISPCKIRGPVIPTSLGCCEAKQNLSSSALRSADGSVVSVGIQTLYKNTEW